MKRKRNIIILTIGVFILSITTVYAITIIRASDVTYDNSKSNGSSTNVQGAIDELYGKVSNYKELLINENMISYIIDLAKSDTTNLAYDDTVDKNLRYIGSNPNNYVEFNGELWRIIGVMNNVKDENGKSASRVKLIRNESIGRYSWDNKLSGTGSSKSPYGSNDWTDSRLMITLNNGPYWNRTNGTCYNGSNNSSTDCDFSSIGLTNDSKSMISNIIWNLGGKFDSNATSSSFYVAERGTNVYTGHATIWNGYVGLMYPSDLGYAVVKDKRDLCLSTNLYDYSNNQCSIHNWLNNSTLQWTLSPRSGDTALVFGIDSSGFVVQNTTQQVFNIRPVVYLDTKILITKGKGTEANPYKISFEEEKEETTCEIKEESKNLITKITNLAFSDTTNLVTDDTIDKNIRYIGKNPNNYIKFNDELWRIIGIMNNVKDANGITTSRVKIIRNESTESLAWDEKNLNNWEESTLEKLLNNGDYFNQKGKYATNGLNTDSKNMIANLIWNLGGYNSVDITVNEMYTYERGTNVISGRPTKWSGYVGLMYPSDFGYAVGGSKKNICLSKKISNYNDSECIENNWLYNGLLQWTLTPMSQLDSIVYRIHSSGGIEWSNSSDLKDVRPVVYLNTDIEVTSGDGSIDNPYIIKKG